VVGWGMINDEERWLLCRMEADGLTLDTSFAASATTPGCVTEGMSGAASAIAIQADGRIVVAGVDRSASPRKAILRRFFPNGIPDPDFAGGTGTATLPGDYFEESAFYALTVAGDGSLVAAGSIGSQTRAML